MINKIALCVLIQILSHMNCVKAVFNYKPRILTVSGYIYSQIGNYSPNVIYLRKANNEIKLAPIIMDPVQSEDYRVDQIPKIRFINTKATPFRLIPIKRDAIELPRKFNEPYYITLRPIQTKPTFNNESKKTTIKSAKETTSKKSKKEKESNESKTSDESKDSNSKEWNDSSSEEHHHKNSGKKHHEHSEEDKYSNKKHKTEKHGKTEFNEEDRSRKGFEDNEGYNKFSTFSKGRKKDYDEEDHFEFNDEKKKKDDSHHDAKKAKHNKHVAELKAGGKINEEKDHQKGSKTVGYHNVLHKDEFKKKRTFYDDLDDRGFYKLFGDILLRAA